MKSFYQLAALAALAANVQAVCPAALENKYCADFPEVDALVAATSGDYTWQFTDGFFTRDGYEVKLLRLIGDSTEAQVPDQWTKDAVLFLPPKDKDCTYWLNRDDDMADSIPKQLFDAGYDVYLGCKRGSTFNQGNQTLDPVTDAEDYWNFNSDTIATNDIPTLVGAIITLVNDDDSNAAVCKKVNIVAQGTGSSEALSTLSLLPTASSYFVSQLINLAPCAVSDQPAACAEESHRMLSAETAGEAPRELSEAVDEDIKEMERELGATEAERKLHSYNSHAYSHSHSNSYSHSHNHYYNDFWSRTARYCAWYTDKCFNFCDWYPANCDEFCVRYPQYCEP